MFLRQKTEETTLKNKTLQNRMVFPLIKSCLLSANIFYPSKYWYFFYNKVSAQKNKVFHQKYPVFLNYFKKNARMLKFLIEKLMRVFLMFKGKP